MARREGRRAWSVNGDAFAGEVKEEVAAEIREHLGTIDFLVYSIAAPRRVDPQTGELCSSVIKPIGRAYTAKTVDFLTGEVREETSHPATEQQVAETVKVRGWA